MPEGPDQPIEFLKSFVNLDDPCQQAKVLVLVTPTFVGATDHPLAQPASTLPASRRQYTPT